METVNTKHTMRSRVTTFGIGMAFVLSGVAASYGAGQVQPSQAAAAPSVVRYPTRR